jgi:MYXO-CTERM domain-containing protein
VNSTRTEPFVELANIPGITGVTTLTLSSSDDGQATVTLPFTYNFLGTNFTTVNVGSNGYFTFGADSASSLSNLVPGDPSGINNYIATIWDDLLHPVTTNARWGVVGTAPNRIVYVEGGPATRYSASGGTLRYQIALYEASGKFEYRVTGIPVNALSATIGYEGAGGTRFHNPLACSPDCATVPSGTTFVTESPYELSGSFANFPRGAFPGTTVTGDITLRNAGTMTATSVLADVYLSTNATLDASDTAVASIGPVQLVGGASHIETLSVSVPANFPPGDYFLLLDIDTGDLYEEPIESNNLVSTPFGTAYDLQPTAILSQNTIGANPGEPITFDVTVTNRGVPYSGPLSLVVHASPDQIFDMNDPRIGDATVTLTGANSEVVAVTLTLPNLAPGSYYPVVVLDNTNAIVEMSETNNTFVGGTTFPTGPDFAITTVTVPAQAMPNQNVSIVTRLDSAAVRYIGPVTYRLVASRDAVYDTNDTLLSTYTVNFNQDDFIDDTRLIAWPATLAPGRYYVVATIDPSSVLAELNETNNHRASATTIVNALDFGTGASVTFTPVTAEAGTVVTVTGALTSLGLTYTGNAPYRIYLSPDDVFDLADDPVLDATVFVAGLSSTPISTTFTVPRDVTVGSYHVIIVADPADLTDEANETNNWSVSTARLNVQGADLRVVSLTGEGTAFIGLPYRVNLTILNDEVRDARGFQYSIRLSENEIIRVTDPEIFRSATTTIAAGATQSFVDEIVLPVTMTSTVYVGVLLDITSRVPETSEANNIGVIQHPILVVDPIPNLTGELIETATAAAAGEQLAVTRILMNDGVFGANAFEYSYYLSTNPTISTDDVLVQTFTGSLAEDEDDFSIDLMNIPSDVPAGTYYLGLIIDPLDLVNEVDEDDNIIVGPSLPVFAAAIDIITDSLPPATIGVPYQVGVYASGGALGIQWAVSVGSLPAGLTLDSVTGIIMGTPTEEGLFTFTLRALSGTAYSDKTYNLRVAAPTVQLAIASGSLPTAIVGREYSATLVAVGGLVPYTWAPASVTAVPAGLTLSPEGVLSGIPQAPGRARMIVRVTDALGNVASKDLAINIITADQTLVITQLPLPTAIVGLPYCGDEAIMLEAMGGIDPYSWSIVGDSAPGMSLSPEGALCGTPELAGSFPLEIRVQDTTGLFDTALFILEVDSGNDLAIATFQLPAGKVGVDYSQEITAVRGMEPFTFSLVPGAGSLPTGLTFDNGVVSGKPTAAGVFAFQVQVVDVQLRSDVQSLSINIEEADPVTGGEGDGCSCEATNADSRNNGGTMIALLAIGALLSFRISRRRGVAAVFAVALAAAPVSAKAQVQVPGTPYLKSQTAHTYEPLANPTALQFADPDEGEVVVNLPFTFKFYDADYSQVTVGANGMIGMGTVAAISFSNQTINSSALHNFISPFWDDLEINPAGSINQAILGSAPNRILVIEWRDVGRFLNTAVSLNMQVRIHEGGGGLIQVDYGTITGTGWSATMGVEDAAGGRGIFFASNACNATCTQTEFPTNQRIEIVQDPGIELVALAVTPPEFAFLGALTQVPVTLMNLHGEVIGPFGVAVTASTDPSGSNAVTVGTSSITLNAFQSATVNVPSVFPASFGESVVYVSLVVDPSNGVPEVNESNNRVSNPTGVRLLQGKPDLAITRVLTSVTNVTAGETVPLTVRVTNVGGEPAANVNVAVMLTTNPVVSPQDAEMSTFNVSLQAGEFDERTIDVLIPANASSGVFRLGALADPENAVDELSESNNGRAASTDLVVTGGNVAIVTTLLPAGYIRQSYVGLLVAVGGSADRTWSITQGQLPTGLGLVAQSGEIYGRPTRAESQTFTVQVDSNGETDTETLTLVVVAPEQPLTVVTRDVPAAIVGQEYSFQIIATGGADTATLTWTATGLPEGMTLSEDGWLSGTPAEAADTPISVMVTDGTTPAARDIMFRVRENANLLIEPAQMPPATYGLPYSFQISSTGGVPPITYLIQFGQLPVGLEMSTDGLIAGTPMQVSQTPFRFSVEARDSVAGTAARDVNTFELVVNDVEGFTIGTETLPFAYLNDGYDVRVIATGGAQPYTWSVDGDLPPGLATSANPSTNELVIAGQPTQLGQYTLTFRATDVEGRTTTRALAIRVIEAAPELPDMMMDDGGCGCSTSENRGSFGASGLALFALAALFLARRK